MKKQAKKRKPKPSASLQKPKRKLGMYRNTIAIADDFNAPLLEEMLDAFEGVTKEKGSKHAAE